MKKGFISILSISCLALVGCDQLSELKSKTIDSLFLDEESIQEIQNGPQEFTDLTELQMFQENLRQHDSGNYKHSYHTAMALLNGKIVPKNESLALKILEQSMNENDQSKLHIFSYWLDTQATEKFDFIFEVLNKDLHVKEVNTIRYNLLAQMYEHGYATKIDIQKALELHKKADQLGYVESSIWLKNYKNRLERQKLIEEKEAKEERIRLEKHRIAMELEAKILQEEAAQIALEEKRRREAIAIEEEKEAKRLLALAESQKSSEHESSSVTSLSSVDITTSVSNTLITTIIQAEEVPSNTMQKRLTFLELQEIEQTSGLQAVEARYYQYVLENDADVQEYLGDKYFESSNFVNGLTFYFLASRNPQKSMSKKMEAVISKMTREEFQEAKLRVNEWLEKINKYQQ